MPRADSSTVCARRQVTTDPLERRTRRSNRAHLEMTAATAVDALRRDAPAVLTVEPGDDVIVRSLDVLGHECPFSGPDDEVPRVLGPDVGLTVTGPIEVRGALGLVGLPPGGAGEQHPLAIPYASGGHLDCRALVRGSTLHLPVTVPGAMLRLGDGHAAQGDGEVAGTAVECGMRKRIRVELLTDSPLTTLDADTPSGRITFDLGTDLHAASARALVTMLFCIKRL